MTTHISPKTQELKPIARRWAVTEAGTTLAHGRMVGTMKEVREVAKRAKDGQRTWCWGQMR